MKGHTRNLIHVSSYGGKPPIQLIEKYLPFRLDKQIRYKSSTLASEIWLKLSAYIWKYMVLHVFYSSIGSSQNANS